jgi:hypothetical protein
MFALGGFPQLIRRHRWQFAQPGRGWYTRFRGARTSSRFGPTHVLRARYIGGRAAVLEIVATSRFGLASCQVRAGAGRSDGTRSDHRRDVIFPVVGGRAASKSRGLGRGSSCGFTRHRFSIHRAALIGGHVDAQAQRIHFDGDAGGHVFGEGLHELQRQLERIVAPGCTQEWL